MAASRRNISLSAAPRDLLQSRTLLRYALVIRATLRTGHPGLQDPVRSWSMRRRLSATCDCNGPDNDPCLVCQGKRHSASFQSPTNVGLVRNWFDVLACCTWLDSSAGIFMRLRAPV